MDGMPYSIIDAINDIAQKAQLDDNVEEVTTHLTPEAMLCVIKSYGGIKEVITVTLKTEVENA